MLDDLAKSEAKKRALVEQLITVKPQYKTLFAGLKLSHPDKVAVVHPIIFLLRRLFLAYAIVFLGDSSHSAIVLTILHLLCLFSLCYSLVYQQWFARIHNLQHQGNEVLLYLFLTLQLALYADGVGHETR